MAYLQYFCTVLISVAERLATPCEGMGGLEVTGGGTG